MISLTTWLRIRNRLDAYFRAKALRPGRIRVIGDSSLIVDLVDVTSSEPAKRARRGAYFVINPESRPFASPDEVAVMRRSFDDRTSPTWVGYIAQSFHGTWILELQPEACEALEWREGDRIGFRRLLSGELLTAVDRRARRGTNGCSD